MAGSLKIVVSGLAKYDLYLLAVKEVRWVEGGSQSADARFSMEIGNLIII
jgi:hypothetical protein